MSAAQIAEAYAGVHSRIVSSAERAGRDPASVRIVAASKYASAGQILDAARAGVSEFGENTAQDLREKQRIVGQAVSWHFLGGIQTNKVRWLDVARVLHSVDRVEEARALQARGESVGRSWDVLIEVNVSGEASKQGIDPRGAPLFARSLSRFPLVRPLGLMVIAPAATDPEDVRWVFTRTRELRDEVREAVATVEELSMGMTDDFEVAVAEGATIVRIGRAIFQPGAPGSPRPEGV